MNVNLPPKGYRDTVEQALSGITLGKPVISLLVVGAAIYLFCKIK